MKLSTGADVPLSVRAIHRDRLGDRVLARVLGGAGEPQQLLAVEAVGGECSGDPHLPLRHGARLVEHDRGDPPGLLQDLGPLDQDPELGAAAGADHQRGRRRETERTRAGDDQHRNCGRERGGRIAGEDEPADERGQGDRDHDGDEDRGDPVDESLDGRLAGLCFGDETADLGERRVGADLRRLDDEATRGVDRRPGDRGTHPHLDGNRLAREHRLVDGGRPLHHDPVCRDLLTGPDDEPLADDELVDRHEHLDTVTQDVRLLRSQLEERADRLAGAAARAGLQVAPDEDQRRDHGTGLEVRFGIEPADEHDGRPSPGSQRADGDQRVHARGAVTRVDECGAVERPARPEHDRRRERERQPLPALELELHHHRQHGQRQAQGDGNRETRLQCPGLVRSGGVDVLERRPVARGGDRCDELVDRDETRVVGHRRLIGGVVDRRLDTLEPVQLALDPRGARRAGHPLEVEAHPLGGGCCHAGHAAS